MYIFWPFTQYTLNNFIIVIILHTHVLTQFNYIMQACMGITMHMTPFEAAHIRT